jgi:hypothetical protein
MRVFIEEVKWPQGRQLGRSMGPLKWSSGIFPSAHAIEKTRSAKRATTP